MPTTPKPASLELGHLTFATAPVADGKVAVESHFSGVFDRLDLSLELSEAWRGRIPLVPLPAPEERPSLQELVVAARSRLRADQQRQDGEELQARRWIAEAVAEAAGVER